MATIFSKLFLWVKGAAVSFILILGVMSAYGWYHTESQKTGGSGEKAKQELELKDKRTF
ncbi:MAG: hypothetical protein IPG23_11470 [Burkholderiales bacterium]|nr:hypothetical protein [Burkholderiales bacterium]